jgi:type I restriction enzyme M protein
MQWIYQQWGDAVYQLGCLAQHEKTILAWCEDNELGLNAKNRSKLLSLDTWLKQQNLMQAAQTLMTAIGTDESSDFNQFKAAVDAMLKAQQIKLTASDKNAILNAVSWYDESAEKVIAQSFKLSSDMLEKILHRLDCQAHELPDFGVYPSDKQGEYISYETNADLRDSESVPLNDPIHRYFQDEVKPHVAEAWINLDSVKIGYEISFNKYFYRHKPLRSMSEVAKDIIALEKQAEGLIAEILGIDVNRL